jgi:phenylacetaldehyde dehydrogenase
MSPSDRMKLVWRIGDLIDREFEPLAVLESLDNGKTVVAAKAYDVPTAREQFYYMSGWATRIEGRTVPVVTASLPARYHAYTRREPVGVCGQITPWNFPLQMAAWKLAPALAAGCAVVLKPAEQTPLTAVRLVELCQEAGVPAGVVNLVTGFGETAGAPLAAHPDVDKGAFTGSKVVRKLLVKAAAGNLKKLTLELGGKSPHIILADADVKRAARAAQAPSTTTRVRCARPVRGSTSRRPSTIAHWRTSPATLARCASAPASTTASISDRTSARSSSIE